MQDPEVRKSDGWVEISVQSYKAAVVDLIPLFLLVRFEL